MYSSEITRTFCSEVPLKIFAMRPSSFKQIVNPQTELKPRLVRSALGSDARFLKSIRLHALQSSSGDRKRNRTHPRLKIDPDALSIHNIDRFPSIIASYANAFCRHVFTLQIFYLDATSSQSTKARVVVARRLRRCRSALQECGRDVASLPIRPGDKIRVHWAARIHHFILCNSFLHRSVELGFHFQNSSFRSKIIIFIHII